MGIQNTSNFVQRYLINFFIQSSNEANFIFCFSLVKMVYSFVERSGRPPTWFEMLHSIRRNFGGLDSVNPVVVFQKNLATVLSNRAQVVTFLKHLYIIQCIFTYSYLHMCIHRKSHI